MKGSVRSGGSKPSPTRKGREASAPITDDYGRKLVAPSRANERYVVPRQGAGKGGKGVKESKSNKKATVLPKPQTLTERAVEYLSLPPDDKLGNGSLPVRFNHYNKSFPVYNSVMKWSDVDDEYACSFVYRGAYRRDMYIDADDLQYEHRKMVTRDAAGDYFFFDAAALAATANFKLELEEGEAGVGAQGLRLRDGPLSCGDGNALRSGNRQVDLLTQDLKGFHAGGNLNSEEARLAMEARDVEDILFS
jgi:hypothetical protein